LFTKPKLPAGGSLGELALLGRQAEKISFFLTINRAQSNKSGVLVPLGVRQNQGNKYYFFSL